MTQPQDNRIQGALQLVLRPLVKILLRYGIGYNEFAEIAKTAYVDFASSDFGIRGRPTNISRVAVMTGLTRKEVRRLRSKIDNGENTVNVRTTPITEIITRWHSEDDYLNNNGRPLVLPYAGGKGTFTELVKQFGGDVPPGAMRTELKRIGLIDEDEDGKLTIKSRVMVPLDSTDTLVTSLVHGAYPLMATIAVNTDPDKLRGKGAAQFTAYSLSIKNDDRTRLKRICYDRLAESAVSFDDLFTAYESAADGATVDSDKSTVMVGLYYFEETDPNATYTW